MDVIKLVRSMQKTVFSLNEFARILKKPKNYSSIVLGRLKRKGLIRKIERNRYALEDTSDNVIFSNLIYPSYLSFLTAFNRGSKQAIANEIASSASIFFGVYP